MAVEGFNPNYFNSVQYVSEIAKEPYQFAKIVNTEIPDYTEELSNLQKLKQLRSIENTQDNEIPTTENNNFWGNINTEIVRNNNAATPINVNSDASYKTQADGKFKSKNDFYNTLRPLVEQKLKDINVDTRFANSILAQWGLESAFGKAVPASYNYAGQTATKDQPHVAKAANGDGKVRRWKKFDSLEHFVSEQIDRLKTQFHAFDGSVDDYTNNLLDHGYLGHNPDQNKRSKYINSINKIKNS